MPGWPTDKAVKDALKPIVDAAEGREVSRAVARDALEAAGLPELVSHAEARAILGTRNPRLPAGMPAPLYENVGDRKLWLRDDVEAFATEFQARPHVRSRRAS
jgi:hypothetical protein